VHIGRLLDRALAILVLGIGLTGVMAALGIQLGGVPQIAVGLVE
jgi:hypothetical protein